MAKRILYFKPENIFSGPDMKDVVVTNNVDIQPNSLSYQCVVSGQRSFYVTAEEEGQPPIIQWAPDSKSLQKWTLDFNLLKSHPRFKTNTLFAIDPDLMLATDDPLVKQPTRGSLVCISSATYSERIPTVDSIKVSSFSNLVFIFVKDVNGTFEDQDIIIRGNNTEVEFVMNSNEDFTTTFSQDTYTSPALDFNFLLDTITITKDSTYSSAEYFKYNVQTEPYIDTVFIETVQGIADKTRVYLKNGAGSFRVLKSSVDGTDKITVKAGFATHLNISTFVDN